MKHTVYHLTHCYETACGCDEIKDIGIFATYQDAVNAQKLVANKSGFKVGQTLKPIYNKKDQS